MELLLTKLGIDWKLLLAQMINFFILLGILYKFAYKPVLDLLDRRSQMIEKGMKDAKESEERLMKVAQLEKERIAATEKEIGRMFEKASTDAETVKKEIVAQAQAQADEMLRRTKLELTEEKQRMIEDIKKEVTSLVIALSEKLMRREFSAGDQKRLSEAIIQEMKSI